MRFSPYEIDVVIKRLLNEAIVLVIRLQNDPENPVSIEMTRSWRTHGMKHE
jgi:transmembrane sensor